MAETLAQAREQQFQDEFQRVLRALFESIEKESTLLRELRLMKESLISVALRLQVSREVNKMDETTIFELRKEIADARQSALSANKQFTEAADVITSLKREINSLKRQIKDVRNVDLTDPNAAPRITAPVSSSSPPQQKGQGATINLGGQSAFGMQADAEVDKLMMQPLYKPPLGPNGKPLKSPLKDTQTPFQDWKMQQYLYAPDTLEGSRNHDPLVVQLLHAAAAQAATGGAGAATGSLFDRTTKSIIAKTRAPDSKAEAEARELAASLHGLTLPAMKHKEKKAKEPGSKNIWGLNPPERLLSRDPLALKRVASPIKEPSQRGSSGGGSVVV